MLLSYIDILAAKKRAYSELARTINCTKDELDQSLTRLSRLREMRESEGSTSSLSNSNVVLAVDMVLKTVRTRREPDA